MYCNFNKICYLWSFVILYNLNQKFTVNNTDFQLIVATLRPRKFAFFLSLLKLNILCTIDYEKKIKFAWKLYLNLWIFFVGLLNTLYIYILIIYFLLILRAARLFVVPVYSENNRNIWIFVAIEYSVKIKCSYTCIK